MKSKVILGIALVIIGLMGMAVLIPLFSMSGYRDGYWPMGGPGMMGDRGAPQYSNGLSITMDQAKYIAEQYPSSLNNPDLAVKEIMEFDYNFYVIFYEKSTGIGAFEMLIWKKDPGGMMGRGGMMGGSVIMGQIVPEPGPNMMWNTKYGGMMCHMSGDMMGGGMMGGQYEGIPTADMPIGEDEGRRIGQQYLDEYLSGATIEESTTFYGYYTFDFGKDGEIYGMFSVNGYNGQIWYHGWHGPFIGMEEYEDDHHD
ncbi:MAG: hypothetical protein NWE86_03775 [Candidatus Bathyarchaeota archaeon]|nr:hypothetical protein [Candidatus Bathyarchaeota archaeon]